MKTLKILSFGMLILSPVCGYAGIAEVGATFLTFFPDARQNGMAGVFTAISDDALATYYNDAGMALQQKYDIGFTHMNWLPGLYPSMYYERLASVVPIFKPDSGEYRQAIGVNVIYLHSGTAEGTDDMGNKIGGWTTWDLSAKVSYANKLTKNFSVGAGVKYLYTFLGPVREFPLDIDGDYITGGGSGKSFAFDFSGLYIPVKQAQIGLSIQNLGPDINYIEMGTNAPLPRLIRAGVSYQPIDIKNNKLVIAGDITKVLVGFQDDLKQGIDYIYRDTWKGIGLEYKFYKIFSVRWGYFSDVAGHRSGRTVGFGVKFNGISIDFADDSALYYDIPSENWILSFHYCW